MSSHSSAKANLRINDLLPGQYQSKVSARLRRRRQLLSFIAALLRRESGATAVGGRYRKNTPIL
jgi:hypothetical protein